MSGRPRSPGPARSRSGRTRRRGSARGAGRWLPRASPSVKQTLAPIPEAKMATTRNSGGLGMGPIGTCWTVSTITSQATRTKNETRPAAPTMRLNGIPATLARPPRAPPRRDRIRAACAPDSGAPRAHDGALSSVALPDRALDVGGDVARVAAGTLAAARPLGRRELARLELECPVEHPSEVSRGKLVSEQLLGVPQLVAGAPSNHELEEEPFGRHRSDLRARANLPRRK